MEKVLTIGSVVYSRAGRDEGRYYIVTEIVSDGFVRIVDGDVRRLDKAKLKKLKHVKVTGDVIESVAEKIKTGAVIYDSEIREALRRYNS